MPERDSFAPRVLSRAVAAAFTTLAVVAGPALPVESIAPEDLAPGTMAEMHTVLRGTSIETLPLEILGVQDDGIGPGIPLILCRLIGERAEHIGVAGGMSGSPVTVDGRLVGALSYSLGPFSKEPACGITPIGAMLDLERYPGGLPARVSSGAGSLASLPLVLASTAPGPLPEELSAAIATRLREIGVHVRPATASAASADGGAASAMTPGAAISALLVWGDIRFGATGTITWRDGDTLLAFGHPFLGAGRVELAVAPAEILYTLPSLASSFKISAIGEPVGTLVQDRLPAVRAELGRTPRGLPMRVDVRRDGHPSRTISVEMARDPVLLPLLADLVVRQGLSITTGYERSEVLRMNARIALDDGRELVVAAAGGGSAGDAPAPRLGVALARRLAMLGESPFALPSIESIHVRVDGVEPHGGWTVVRALPDRVTARPGETIRVRVELEGRLGMQRAETLEIVVPDDAREGAHVLFTGSAAALSAEFGSLDEARRRTARDASEYLEAVAGNASPLELVVRLAEPSEGIVAHGRAYPALPSTAHLALRSRPGGGEKYRVRYRVLADAVVPVDRPLDKVTRSTIRIRTEE